MPGESITTTETSSGAGADERARGPVLHPVDRIMELLFGLLMALSFTGAMSSRSRGVKRCASSSSPPSAATSPGVSSTP
jgi:hypothetical protein